jgi:hypothetical protein
MAEFYFSATIDNETTLCIAPLSNKRIAMSGQDLPDRSGYFLFETCKSHEPNEVRVMARLLSEEAAIALSRLLHMD